MTYVLDASALLRFLDREPGAERVRDLLQGAVRKRNQLLLSAANWGELVHAIYKRNSDNAEAILADMQRLPITIVPVDVADATVAGKLKWKYRIPYADALAAALTVSRSQSDRAVLVTADYDFKSLEKGLITIEFLPAK
jgi:predicted nucleic acid-binding protein